MNEHTFGPKKGPVCVNLLRLVLRHELHQMKRNQNEPKKEKIFEKKNTKKVPSFSVSEPTPQ
jgi:hypothetical protein